MPTINDKQDRDDETLIDRLVERAQLDLIDEVLKGEGPVGDYVRETTAGDEEALGRVVARARTRLDELARTAGHEATRRTAERMFAAPRERILAPFKPQVDEEAEVQTVDGLWKHVELRIDRAKCVRETLAEPGADEMYLIGKISLTDRPSRSRRIDFHLGDFRTGDVDEYGGTAMIRRISLAGSKFPTRAVCFLSVVEKDKVGAFQRFLERVLDSIENALAEQAGDKTPPDWWKAVRAAADRVIDALFGWISRPEVLKYQGEHVFTYESPRIGSLADTWGTDHDSPTRKVVVKGHGGRYELSLLFRRVL